MNIKVKALLLSTVLAGAMVGLAAPAQAHHDHEELWPYYGLLGLVLLNSYSSPHHSEHRYHDNHRPNYGHRRHNSRGYKGHYRPYHRGKCSPKHKHRHGKRLRE